MTGSKDLRHGLVVVSSVRVLLATIAVVSCMSLKMYFMLCTIEMTSAQSLTRAPLADTHGSLRKATHVHYPARLPISQYRPVIGLVSVAQASSIAHVDSSG